MIYQGGRITREGGKHGGNKEQIGMNFTLLLFQIVGRLSFFLHIVFTFYYVSINTWPTSVNFRS
jgi:hypothetical protein